MTERKLVLLRHAKAEHTAQVSDAERGLTARGRKDAYAAGRWLAAEGIRPDLVLSSPSRRTRETWQEVQRGLGHPAPAVFDPRLYEGGSADMIQAIRTTEPTVQTLLVIGHNPTVSTVSAALDPEAPDDDGLRTGGLAVHRLSGSWNECGPREAPLTAAHTARG
jgi:phosphohistidine phosphatase